MGKLSFYFFLSKIVPATSGVLQIAFLLKGLGVEGYGTFALLLSTASIASVVFLQWIQKAMLRYVSDGEGSDASLATYQIFLSLCIFALACVGEFLYPGRYVFACSLLALSVSMKELVLEKFRAQAKVKLYGYLYGTSSLCLTGLAYLTTALDVSIDDFVYLWGGVNLLFGLPFVLDLSRTGFRTVSLVNFVELFRYGFPLALSGALGQVYFSGVRLLIGYWHGAYEAGIYSAIYDLVQRSMVVYMQIINSASFPLIRRRWDLKDFDGVGRLLRSNFLLLMYPTTFGLIFIYILWPYIVQFLSMGEMREYADLVLLVGVGVILNRIKTFHVDYVFYLAYLSRNVFVNMLLSVFALIFLLVIFGRSASLYGISSIVIFSYFFGLVLASTKAAKVYPEVLNILDVVVYLSVLMMASGVSIFWMDGTLYKCVALLFIFAASVVVMFFAKYKPLLGVFKV